MKYCYDIKIWDQEFTGNNFTRTVDNFWALVLIFIQLKFENNNDTYKNHKKYLLAVTKKKEMTVTLYVLQLRYHNNSVLPLLLGASPDQNNTMFSEQKFKAIVYKCMPSAWRKRFENFHTLINSALQVIKAFMERQHLKADNTRNRNTDDSRRNDHG